MAMSEISLTLVVQNQSNKIVKWHGKGSNKI